MKRQTTKLLSLLLAFVMVVSMLPMTVLAEDDEDPANVPIMLDVEDDLDEESEEDSEEPTTDTEEPAADSEETTTDSKEPIADSEEPTADSKEPTQDPTELDEDSGEEPEGGIMLLGMSPVNLLSDETGTLQFGTDLNPEYIYAYNQWGAARLTVAVSTYTLDGGEPAALPDGTTVTYQWYASTDDKVSDDDTKKGTGAGLTIGLGAIGWTYYYVVATATIDGVEYTGTSTMTCFKVGAADIKVTLTVNNKGVLGSDKNGAAVCSKSITVSDVDADGKLTYDEALQAAHKTCLTADAYATAESSYGLMVTKLWGVETSNCLFYLNGAALTVNVGETTVKANDALYASINQDDTYYSDKFTTFDATSKTVSTGVSFDLILKDANGNVVPGIAVGTWKDGAFVPMEDVTTDENGKVTLTFDEAGTYYVTAKGTIKDTVTTDWSTGATAEYDCPIMAPGAAITVKQRGELKFVSLYVDRPDHFGDQPYTYKVGETNTFNSMLVARYYVNNVYDSAVKATTTWYRIKDGETEPQKVDKISAAFTDADLGTWKYYMYAECDGYGVPMTAQTNYATVVVSEATPLVGTAANGYVSDLDYLMAYNLPTHPDFQYEEGKTDYTISRQNKAKEALSFSIQQGSGLWYGWRIDGIKTSATKDTEHGVMTGETVSLNLPAVAPVGETHTYSLLVGLKYDSDQNDSIDQFDDFDPAHCDVYNFTATTVPGLPSSSITVKDGDGNTVTMTADVPYGSYDSYGSTNSDKIKLSVTIDAGVKLYIGKATTPYTATVSDMELSLADYRDEKGVSNIPLYVYAADGTEPVETVTLHLNGIAGTEPVITTQPTSESEIDKGEKIALSITVEEPADGSTLSYQWKVNNSKFSTYSKGTDIPGATSSSYEVEGQETLRQYQNPKYYACQVTLTTPDGKTSSVLSDSAAVTTKLTYVSEPVISIQPGTCADKNGKGIYNTEYVAGARFDTMWFGVQSSRVSKILENGSRTYINVTEPGCNKFEVECFYNTTPSTEGATQIQITKSTTGMTGGNFGAFFGYTPEEGLPEGENYVFFKVTSTAEDDPTKTTFTYTDFVKLTYTKADLGLEGSGTEEDPFLLKTGEDFVTIQKQVNENAFTFAGMYFKMANDITLPEDWVSIGLDGVNGKYFGGTLDGDGHQLSYAKGSQPLFKYVSQGRIRNLKLYGEEIQGCGLIDSYWLDYNTGAWIDNVTLVSGTSTLDSGLVRGAYSAANPTYITNCHAEDGVVIGYTKDKSGISTFTCGFVGTVENCTSAATVYGVGNIGGIAGTKTNSMGRFSIKNCSFTGTIVATGSYIGGIAGQGYVSNSAPNATCAVIENCYVNASITGKDAVGGIYGGEGGVDQCWDNGIGNIRNNLFCGSLCATGGNAGGIVGFMRSLNRYNVIENNFYFDTNGCTKAIGGVEHIDTSARAFGMNEEEGVFYYDTSKDSLDDIKEFVDAEDKGTDDWRYTSVCKTDHNRTDDPMGADNAKLGRACTAEEMKDGTVLLLINSGEGSLKNWVQGEESPVISDAAVVSSLSISGDYKTEYYIGEELDLTGAVFTATWSDGSTTSPAMDEVTISGFDSSKRAVLTLTAAYGGAKTEFEVKVLKQPTQPEGGSTIKVYFTLMGDEKHGDPTEATGTHTLKDKNLETWIEKTAYTVDMNATVWDLMQAVEKNYDVSFSNPTGNYVDYVTFEGEKIGEFDNGNLSGWMYTLNGKHPLLGVSEQFLEDGDKIVFHYTDDYTVEEGSEPWWDENHSGSGAAANTADQKAADEVNELIQAIGTVTKDSGAKIEAARAAYDKLTSAQKKLVSDYDKLVAAESAYAQLTLGLPFTDVKGTDYFYEAVKWAVEQGITNGTTDTAFSPNVGCTRAQMVTFLWRAAGSPEPAGKTNPFTDVNADAYYFKALLWAIENGITNGTTDTTFSPNAACTRGQMAAFLYRNAKSPAVKGENPFTDVKEGDYFCGAVIWAAEEDITKGTTDTTFSPAATCTRGQMVTFLYRYLVK